MAWSSYAHLPNREDEYWKILSELKDEMHVAEVDKVIASVKGKEKVQHHYRSNLANIGLFDICGSQIHLNYDVQKLTQEKVYLYKILSECVLNCKSIEIGTVKAIILQMETYSLGEIVDSLKEKYPELEKSNLIRWIRPIVNLLNIVNILEDNEISKKDEYERFLQEAYLNLSRNFGKVIALEEMDKELKKIEDSFEIAGFLEKVLANGKVKFKIELLMMPTWATQNKSYKIKEDYYTHLRMKTNLV